MFDRIRTTTGRLLFATEPSRTSRMLAGAISVLFGVSVLVFLLAPAYALPVIVAYSILIAVGWRIEQALVARLLMLIATVVTVLTVAFIVYYLFASAYPAFRAHGIELLTVPVQDGEIRWFFWLETILPTGESVWDPNSEAYSLIPALWATVIVTIIAGMVAGPFGILGAVFIAEIAGDRTRELIKPAIEILAGIPSIVYGFIGFQVLNTFVQTAFLDQGASFLISGIVVGVMALPTVVSVSEDALTSVPDSMRDGSMAIGVTQWQTIKSISIPTAFSGISAAVILGLGRAIGETMAVTAIMQAGLGLPDPLYDVFGASATLTSLIASRYGSASQGTLDVLFVAGVVLFCIVASMSIVSQYIERRMDRRLTDSE